MITNPSLIAIYFYKCNGVSGGQNLFNRVVEKNELTEPIEEKNDYKKYANIDRSCCAEWLLFHDIEAVRIVLNKIGDYSPAVWTEQKGILARMTEDFNKNNEMFLGTSTIYRGLIDHLDESTQRSAIQEGMRNRPIKFYNKTEHGWLWQIGEFEGNTIEYVFLLLKSMNERADEEFIFAKESGILKIDSHLHKGYNQIGYYEDAREKVMMFAKELDAEQLKLVKSLGNLDVSEQKERLDAISESYVNFVERTSWVRTIQNIVNINLENYRWRWSQIEGNDGTILNYHQKRFERALEQMKWDFNYYDTIMNGVRTGLEVVRSMNLTSMQKRGMSFQAAVAVVESVFVFYYSLGIWHFLIEEVKWQLISGLDKAVVGLGLAITMTLGSHFFFTEKNRNYYRICIFISLILMSYAFIATYNVR